MQVHETAVIHPNAHLGAGVEVGPYCVIGPSVRLGDGCRLHAHVVIEGDTVVGESCEFWPFATIGTRPQDRKLEPAAPVGKLRIGSHNTFRENVTVSPGTTNDRGVTTIGDHNLLLIGAHVGHDARLGDHVIMTNGAMAAGHVELEDRAVLGAMVGIHQFCRVGFMAMAGAGSMVPKDAPPFSLVHGDRARIRGVNVVGMRRAGYTDEDVAVVKRAFRVLFWRSEVMAARIDGAARLWGDHPLVRKILNFMEGTARGVLMARGRTSLDGLDEQECTPS